MTDNDKEAFQQAHKDWMVNSGGKDMAQYFWEKAREHYQPRGLTEGSLFEWKNGQPHKLKRQS